MGLDDEESFALPSRKGYEISASRGKRASRLHGGPQRLEAAFSLAYSGTTGSRALPEPKN